MTATEFGICVAWLIVLAVLITTAIELHREARRMKEEPHYRPACIRCFGSLRDGGELVATARGSEVYCPACASAVRKIEGVRRG